MIRTRSSSLSLIKAGKILGHPQFDIATRKFSVGEYYAFTDVDRAVPNGYHVGSAVNPPIKSGAMRCYWDANGSTIDIPANLAGGKNAEASVTGSGYFTGALGLIVPLAASILGVGTFDVIGNILGILDAEADVSGTSSAGLELGALVNTIATVACTSTVMADIIAKGDITGEAATFEELSPKSLARAVWSERVDQYGDPVTFGRQFQTIVDATPESIAQAIWSEDISAYVSQDQFGFLVQEIYNETIKRLSKTQFLALK